MADISTYTWEEAATTAQTALQIPGVKIWPNPDVYVRGLRASDGPLRFNFGTLTVVRAVDQTVQGLRASDNALRFSFGTLTVAVAGGGGGASPEIENLTPTTGSQINSGTTLGFDVVVSDATPLRLVVVGVRYNNLDTSEFVYEGDQFLPYFEASSTVEAITNGYRFRLKRRGGWPADPRVFVRAVSEEGAMNE